MESLATFLGVLIFMAFALFTILVYCVIRMVKEWRTDRLALWGFVESQRQALEHKDNLLKEVIDHYNTRIDEERRRFIVLFMEKTGEKLQHDLRGAVQNAAFRVLSAYGTPPLKENGK